MKYALLTAAASLAVLAGCAATSPAPAGMKVGQFVTYKCDGGKQLQARLAEGGSSVRIRYEGGYELDRKAGGVYEADGWMLMTQRAGGLELQHNGKPAAANCKA
ncbi:MAG: hypothetical protein Q8R01_05980 [Ramlibacter sp.]|nr:hypothetical protein [Ramlibacter sp.]